MAPMQVTAHDNSSTTLLTGVTGIVGSVLLPRLLRAYPDRPVAVLVRGIDAADAARRFDEEAAHVGLSMEERRRVWVCHGDVSSPCLGLSTADFERLSAETRLIFHLAASVDLSAPLDEARRANVESTRQMLAFAEAAAVRGGLERLHFMSTAYVAGDRRGRLLETELQCGQRFWNSYEQTKAEAEELVRATTARLPVTIYRPSMIIGETVSGRVRRFVGLYRFPRLALKGKLRLLIADPQARIDLIPADFVCDAMLHLARSPGSEGRTYHLAAGTSHSLRVHEIYELLIAHDLEAKRLREIRLVAPHDFNQVSHREQLAYRNSAAYLLMKSYQSYLSYERDFDVADTHRQLARGGIAVPPIADVVLAGARYALERGFADATV